MPVTSFSVLFLLLFWCVRSQIFRGSMRNFCEHQFHGSNDLSDMEWNDSRRANYYLSTSTEVSLVRSIFVRHLHSFNVKSHEICGPCFWFLLFGNLTFERCVSDATFFSFFSLGVLSWSLSFLRLFVHNLLIHWFFDVLKSIEMKSFSFLFFVFCLWLVALPRSADFKLCHRGANSI